MKILQLAWRNLWRNSRRTAITMASVFFGVILSTLMTSLQNGSYDAMINNVVKFYSGYAQVFTEKYDKNKAINNTFELTDSISSIVLDIPEVTNTAPRLEYFALASSEELTKGAMIVGIDPEQENKVTNPEKWIEKGQYLKEGDDGVLLAVNLANYLHLNIGDTLILYGQGYHGVTAAGLYPVKGILNFPLPALNNQLVYLDIKACQELFGATNRITSLIVMVKDHYDLPAAMKDLRTNIKSPLMVKSWAELQPELVQMIEADRAGGIFMKIILYMVIGFGIFGTIIMMVSERIRELGVTIAVGMQKSTMSLILFIETILTGLMGTLVGLSGSVPIINFFYNNPVKMTGDAAKSMTDMGIEPYFYFSWNLPVFYNQAITVFILTFIIGFYSIYKVYKIKVNQALRA